MDFKGTKGWVVDKEINDEGEPAYVSSAESGWAVAEVYSGSKEHDNDATMANARLISQAPDLLKSLQKLVEMMKSPCVLSEEGFLKELDETVSEAEEVINKSLNIE